MKLHVKRPVNDPDKRGPHTLYVLVVGTGGISKLSNLALITTFKMKESDDFPRNELFGNVDA